MGQYWIPVNLDKKEFVHPHKLGSGLKLWEMLAAQYVGSALIVLTAAYREHRDGGDLDLEENWHCDMNDNGHHLIDIDKIEKMLWDAYKNGIEKRGEQLLEEIED